MFANYLENYPFPYYLVVQSVQSLPEILSDALTQWFELINSNSSTYHVGSNKQITQWTT